MGILHVAGKLEISFETANASLTGPNSEWASVDYYLLQMSGSAWCSCADHSKYLPQSNRIPGL